jgi:hypothetical protein
LHPPVNGKYGTIVKKRKRDVEVILDVPEARSGKVANRSFRYIFMR